MRLVHLAACILLGSCGGPGRPPPPAPEEGPLVIAPVDPPVDAAAPDAEVPADGAAAAGASSPPIAPPPAPRVTVAFSVQPPIGEKPPTLRVTVRNPNPTAVPFTRFDAPACFTRHYLAIELTRTDGTPVVALPCASKSWPGKEEQLAPNAVATVDLPLAKLYAKLTAGVYELGVDWDPAELERARPGAGVDASSTSLDADRFAIARVRAAFRIARGKSVALPGGFRLTFRAHGHKHVMAGGPSSPLIIHGSLAAKQQPPDEFSVNVYPDESRVFSIDDHVFELVAHQYDGWMQLRYFGQLELD